MKIDELTLDGIKALALNCPIECADKDGRNYLQKGQFLAYAARSEEVKRYAKAAKRDLFDREMRGGSYEGDHGHVTIGGHRFTLYRTTPPVLMRDDFANWIEANWRKHLKQDGTERQSTKHLKQEDVVCMPIAQHSLAAKLRAKELNEPTELIHDDAWNSQYDMERRLHEYHREMERDRKSGRSYIVTRLQAVLLAAMAQHRRRNYAQAVDDFISVAACAIKAAEFEARRHSKEEEKK